MDVPRSLAPPPLASRLGFSPTSHLSHREGRRGERASNAGFLTGRTRGSERNRKSEKAALGKGKGAYPLSRGSAVGFFGGFAQIMTNHLPSDSRKRGGPHSKGPRPSGLLKLTTNPNP